MTRVDRRNELHRKALRVIDDFTRGGVPYVLYLRKFDFHVLHGPDGAHRELLENHLLDEVSKLGGNVVSIQEPGDAVASYLSDDLAFARRAPALSLGDDEWVEYARPLIADADLVVSECLMVSPGVRAELRYAYTCGSVDRIALLLPPPGSPFAAVDDEPEVQFVPRAVYAHELGCGAFLDSFAVRDLVQRLARIAALPGGQRLALARDRARKLREHPVTWAGVAAGYEAAAVVQELSDEAGGETDDSWWLRFWWHFRRVATLGWQVQRTGLPEREAAASLVDGYLKLGQLQIRFDRQADRTVVIRGDLDFAEQCAQSADVLTRRNRLALFEPLVGSLRASLDEIRSVQAARPGQVLVRPRTRPILTRPSGTRGPTPTGG